MAPKGRGGRLSLGASPGATFQMKSELRFPPILGSELRRVAGRLPFLGDQLLLERSNAGRERRHVRKAFCRRQSVGPLHFQDVDTLGRLDPRDQARDAIAPFKQPYHDRISARSGAGVVVQTLTRAAIVARPGIDDPVPLAHALAGEPIPPGRSRRMMRRRCLRQRREVSQDA